MGSIERSVLSNGGRATGVIPQFMYDNDWHEKDCELIVTETMHERKHRMCQEADAFIAMPGGLGTIEELAETMTWKQLGLELALKPIVVLNVNGYWDPFLQMLDRAMDENFMNKDEHHKLYNVANSADEVLDAIRRSQKWTADHQKYVSDLMHRNDEPGTKEEEEDR